MRIGPGARLGPYEVLSALGAGGMGEVWRARDSRLGRDVALKVLPEAFVADPERLARFEREAKVLASLNHPHIGGIHGLEEADGGAKALVLELVEGPTLADRIARGPLPIDEALPIAQQIAEGLEAAHEKGIIHRDLKPANIKVRSDGTVKVLDFGLAKALEPQLAVAHGELSHSPTLSLGAATQMGVILGTAAYMAPEQARGKTVDKRADIWAFGCVLYEMLSGRRAFAGGDVTDTLAAVLRSEPEWELLPPSTPRPILRLIRRCLEKAPEKRLRDIGDARLEIEQAIASYPGVPEPNGTATSSAAPHVPGLIVRVTPWAIAVVAALIASIAVLQSREGAAPPPRPMTRTSIVLPSDAPLAPPSSFHLAVGRRSLVLAPDGSFLVYVTWVDHTHQLYRRDMRSGATTPIVGTATAQGPFFSPDSEWVAFFADGRLKKVPLKGGEPEVLATAVWGYGGNWGDDGYVYFTPTEASGVYRVPENGGPVEPVTVLPDGIFMHTHPWLVPGTSELLFTSHTRGTSVAHWSIGPSQVPAVLLDRGHGAQVTPNGYLIFMDEGRMLAVRYDKGALKAGGVAKVVLDDVREDSKAGYMSATFSNGGVLVYPPGSDINRSRFVWIDRRGNRLPLSLPVASYGDFEVSPDSRSLAYTLTEGLDSRIWIYDIERGAGRPLTPGPRDLSPSWSRTGDMVFYTSETSRGRGVSRISAQGSASAIEVLAPPTGSFGALAEAGLLYTNSRDIFLAPWADPWSAVDLHQARPILSSQAQESFAALSPDEHWLAYMSDETGTWEIWVTDFPGTSIKRRVSTAGGEEPRWSPDGGQILWRFGVNWFSVAFEGGEEPKLGALTTVLSGPYINVPGYSWDGSRDGKRFLVLENEEASKPLTELVVIHDFFDEVERLVPSQRD